MVQEYQEYLYQLFNPIYEKNIKEGQTQSETLLNHKSYYKIETCNFLVSFIGDGWISETIEYDNQIITLVESCK